MRQCLFCHNQADTKEHVCPDWILKRIKSKAGVRHKIGKQPEKFLPDADIRIKRLCSRCNHGWMSALEEANKPLIGVLMDDIGLALAPQAQRLISAWTAKTSMVLDSLNSKRSNFFSPQERTQLRLARTIPPRTIAWLGRFPLHTVHFGGTDIWAGLNEHPKAVHGCVSSFVLGHLVIQTLTIHVAPEYDHLTQINLGVKNLPYGRSWDEYLVSIWPPSGRASWPPPRTFENGGVFSIGRLFDRWHIGQEL
jgi:hypothetical protein